MGDKTFSRRLFLRASASVPAAVIMPPPALVSAVTNPATAAAPVLPLMKMAFNRCAVLGVLDALTGVLMPAANNPATDIAMPHGHAAHQIGQISDLMRHARDLSRKDISFGDFSRESLIAWQSALRDMGETNPVPIQDAVEVLAVLKASGCQSWQDVTKVMLGKALPLMRRLEQGDFLARAQACGHDGGVLGAVDHIARECERVLGVDFQPYKASFDGSLQSLREGWKNACTAILEHEWQRRVPPLPRIPAPQTPVERMAKPETFRRSVDVEAVFWSGNKAAYLFRIIPRSGQDVNFLDLCRISRQLTTGGKLPLSWARRGGKKGFVIAATEPRLVNFLSACAADSHKRKKPADLLTPQ